MQTEMGRIAGLLRETVQEATPLQRELDRTGKRLGAVVVAIAIIMIVTIVLVEDVHGAAALLDVLLRLSLLDEPGHKSGKEMLVRVVSMLIKLAQSLEE